MPNAWWGGGSMLVGSASLQDHMCHLDLLVHKEGLDDGPWVGQPRRLHHDAVQRVLALEQLPHDADEVPAYCRGRQESGLGWSQVARGEHMQRPHAKLQGGALCVRPRRARRAPEGRPPDHVLASVLASEQDAARQGGIGIPCQRGGAM